MFGVHLVPGALQGVKWLRDSSNLRVTGGSFHCFPLDGERAGAELEAGNAEAAEELRKLLGPLHDGLRRWYRCSVNVCADIANRRI